MQRHFVISIIEQKDETVKDQIFCMQLDLSWCKLKLKCYSFKMLNVTMLTTKKNNYRLYTKGTEKGIKYAIQK